MPTITLTQSACSAGLTANWTAIDSTERVNFENAVNATLGGSGIEITRITISGRVRNSATAVKRLRLGFKPAISSGRDTWSTSGGSSVLDSAFTAIDAAKVAGTYIYRTFTRVYDGSNNAAAFALFSTHIRSSFAASTPVYLGIIQPDASRAISIYVEGYWKITVTYELIGNIPTANVTTAEIGTTEITTTINKVVDGSSTTLRYKIGSTTLQTVSGITGTTDAYTPPTSVGQYFPSTLTGTLTIEAETFVGETSYGIVTTSVTLTLPSDKAPTCTTTPSVAWVDGVDAGAQFDVYVQGKGGVRVETTATAMYGATVAGITVTCEGKTYSGADVTHKPFTGSGSIKVYTQVTDSRGVVSAVHEDTLTVIAWKQPQITAFSVGRVDASGDPQRDGVRMKATIKATANSITVASAEENSIEFQVEYREKGAATWTEAKAVSIAGISVDGGYVLKDENDEDIVTFDDMKGYDFILAVADIYAASTASAQIATSEIIADFNTVDNGVAIGGESTGEKFESYKPAYFYDGIPQLDYSATAVDTGIKWLNGRKIYRKTFIFGSMETSGALDIPIGEAAIEEVVHLRGGLGLAGGVGFQLLPFTHQATPNYQKSLTINSMASNPVISIRMGTGAAAPVGGYVVIEYVPIDPATQWSKPYMTAASESGCVVSASSAESETYAALKGFSVSPTEYWVSTLADAERWIQMQMPGGRTNIVLYICNQNTASGYPSVKAGTFYGSNDGSTWDALGTFNNRPDNLNFALTVHHLKNQTPYSYIRIKITSPGANVDKARIGRISVFGDIA